MGSRGASSGASWEQEYSGGSVNIISTTSLISERERQQREVDEVLSVFSDLYDRYGTVPYDVQIATLSARDAGVMAYYDSDDNLAVNVSYFDSEGMARAYAETVKSGFHPNNGNKTAMQAVVAHELGHTMTARAAGGFDNLDAFARKVVTEAAHSRRYKNPINFAKTISGYAKTNPAEAIAEAFADVYCNGSNAKSASTAIVDTMNKYLKK